MELAEPRFLDETAGFHMAVLALDCRASHSKSEVERDARTGLQAWEEGNL